MAPVSKNKGRDVRSRNTTPLSTTSTEPPTSTGPATTGSFQEILDQHGRTNSTPSSEQLKKIKEALQTCSDVAKIRSDAHDKGMRETSKRRKVEVERHQEQELEKERGEEERREKAKRGRLKKERDEDRPLAVGAHGVARQDGVATEESEHLPDAKSPSAVPEVGSPTAPRDPSASESSDSAYPPRQPRPAPAIPQRQTFGPDPSKFDDPTIYHIRPVKESMTEEEKRETLQVADYPHDDLYRLTAGTAPDRDLTSAKPANQVTAQAFQNYTEPYFRSMTEEDIAFLKERGDRSGPMVIPRRGPRGYKEIWAAEDRSTFEDSTDNDPLASTNQAMGSIEQMTEAASESSRISTGPMLARLLQTLRPERRPPLTDSTSAANVIGEADHVPAMNGELTKDLGNDDQSRPLPPATYLNETNQGTNKGPASKIGWAEMDEKVKAELRHIGFLSDDAEPDYDGHHDDEVAARLRFLQEELQRVSILNGARKARVLELVEASAAQQEYSHIADDLDTQLNQAYLKRHRNVAKGKHKLKRPGGAGGGSHPVSGAAGVSRPGIGEPIKALMERRRKWNETIGPVVDYGRKQVPEESIFDAANLKRLEAKEREMWAEAQDQS